MSQYQEFVKFILFLNVIIVQLGMFFLNIKEKWPNPSNLKLAQGSRKYVIHRIPRKLLTFTMDYEVLKAAKRGALTLALSIPNHSSHRKSFQVCPSPDFPPSHWQLHSL